MIISNINRSDVWSYTLTQIDRFLPLATPEDNSLLRECTEKTLLRISKCFGEINHHSYSTAKGEAKFNIFNSDQYCSFLCLLASEAHRLSEHGNLASRIFYLNKILHGVNCTYHLAFPDVFWIIHGVGTVIGNAKLSEYLVVRQGCTIGAIGGEYPEIGEGFIMSANTSIIGSCKIGRNVMLEPGSVLLKQSIPDNQRVSGNHFTGYTLKAQSEKALAIHFHL